MMPSLQSEKGVLMSRQRMAESLNMSVGDDLDIDDETLTEEQFLKELDDLGEAVDISVEEPLDDISGTHNHVRDEFSNHLESFCDPSAGQTEILTGIANKRAERITKKMKVICVAPGESGIF